MAAKCWSDMQHIGAHVCDMHYGLVLPDDVECCKHWTFPVHGGSHVIAETVNNRRGPGAKRWFYTNKYLVVLGDNPNGGVEKDGGTLLLAYSYDDTTMGYVSVKRKAVSESSLKCYDVEVEVVTRHRAVVTARSVPAARQMVRDHDCKLMFGSDDETWTVKKIEVADA